MVTHAEEDIFELLSKLDTLIGSLDRWSPSDLELLSNWLVDTMTEVNDKWESPECKEPGGIVVKHEVIDRSKVSTWLGKVLASPIFCCSRNHQKLLRYLVEQTLDGNGERLKGYCIGVKVFVRPDLLPIYRTKVKFVKSVNFMENDGYETNTIYRRTDHRLSEASRSRNANQGALPSRWV